MNQIKSCDVEICRQWIINNLKPVELDKNDAKLVYDR